MSSYNAKDIQVLEGLEAVRKRPGMYIGNTSFYGLHHLVWEILDNSVDEILAGFCNQVTININKDNSITVIDNGRGIPVDIVKKTNLSGVETVYTILHAGGKFGSNGYKISGGLHGVGASVVNALSEWLEVTVQKDGGKFYIKFNKGGKTEIPLKKIGLTNETGTIVTFKPDSNIFENIIFDYKTIRDHLKQMAFLNKEAKFTINDYREENKTETFYFKGGIKEYVNYLNDHKNLINKEIIYCNGSEKIEKNNTDIVIYVEAAIQYNESYSSSIFTFCNNINTKEGGTHDEGFRLAMNRVINNYARKINFLKENNDNFTTDDIKEGLTAVISVKHPNPQYEGQTKTKLGNSEVRKIVSNIIGNCLNSFLLENPQEAKAILVKINNSSIARIAAKKAQEMARNKNNLEFSTLPGKLADCQSSVSEECELFIVEGTSAGGSAKNGRDRRIQAILTLRGKILNIEKADQKRIFDNAEIGNMITAIGAGINSNFDISKIRYHKIIIMTDADVDGSHIQVLLLTFFFRFMKDLIINGNVYIAMPPLYKVNFKQKNYLCYNDKQLNDLKKELKIKDGYPYQRYKGLGEMDPKELFDTTMNPKVRKLIRVTIKDAVEADQIFTILMGNDVLPRKEFIFENAKFVKNLDL